MSANSLSSSQLLDSARNLLKSEKYDEAHEQLLALSERSGFRFKAYLELIVLLRKTKKYDEALYQYGYTALKLALKKKNDREIGDCLYNIGLVLYNSKQILESWKYFTYAKSKVEKPTLCEMWQNKVYNNLKFDAGMIQFFNNLNLDDSKVVAELEALSGGKCVDLVELKAKTESAKSEAAEATKEEPKIYEINKPEEDKVIKDIPSSKKASASEPASVVAPAAATASTSTVAYPKQNEIRTDFYETTKAITISVYIKKVPKESFKCNFGETSMQFEFKTPSGSDYVYEFENLAGKIDAKECTFKVYGTKVELVLAKKEEKLWKRIESPETAEEDKEPTVLQYPSSARVKHDWSELENEAKDLEDEGDDMKFFKDLYKNADEDTRRAMMKSYQESGGTSLSTNWKEVQSKKYEIDPPEGMEVKYFEQ